MGVSLLAKEKCAYVNLLRRAIKMVVILTTAKNPVSKRDRERKEKK